MSLIAEEDQDLLGNMPEVKVIKGEELVKSKDWNFFNGNLKENHTIPLKKVLFSTTPKMSSYLFAFYTHHLAYLEKSITVHSTTHGSKNILVRSYSSRGKENVKKHLFF